MSESPSGLLVPVRILEVRVLLRSPVVAQLENSFSTEFGVLLLLRGEVLSFDGEGEEVARGREEVEVSGGERGRE